jgi:hypothetical protein
MMFERPENMGHLAQILRQVISELNRTKASLQSGAGSGTAELIRGAYEYASADTGEGDAKADAKGVEALGIAQRAVQGLEQAEAQFRELANQVRIAVREMSEADARLDARVAKGNRYRV